jgi:hypothetical protein
MIMTSKKSPMKPKTSRGLLKPKWSKTQTAAWAGLVVSLSPLVAIIATLVLSAPPMAFEWSVLGTTPDNSLTMKYFTFWGLLPVIGLGPYIFLTGAAVLALAGLTGSVKALFPRDASTIRWRKTRIGSGLISLALIVSMTAVPKGPDPCSRKLTSTAYDRCLETEFENLSISEARDWLKHKGYILSGNYTLRQNSMKHTESRLIKTRPLKYPVELRFRVYREDQYPEIIPYGTVFNRLFGRIWGAGKRFNLDVYASSTADRVVAVRTDWVISWL